VKTIKKINYKIIIAALVTGLLVFILAFADKTKAARNNRLDSQDFHYFVSSSLAYRALEALDLRINDALYQPDDNVSLDIVVIGIDAETQALERYGDFQTWSRGLYADLLDNLHYDGGTADPSDDSRPAVVCFDILFTRNGDAEGDQRFADTCEKYGDTIQGIYYTIGKQRVNVNEVYDGNVYEVAVLQNIARPYPALDKIAKVALTNNSVSDDGYARTVFTDIYSGEKIDSLPLAAYKSYLEYNGEEYVPHKYLEDGTKKIYFTYSKGFPKNGKPFDYIPFYQALEFTPKELAERCADCIVFVGGYDRGMQDDFFTPATRSEKMYGVDIHANTLEAIAQGKLQIQASRTATAIVYSILSIALIFFVYFSSLPIAIIGSVGAIILDFLANYIARKSGIYLQVVYFIVPAFIVLVTAIALHYLVVRAEKNKINNAFKMYVAPEVVDEMADSGTYELKLGGQTKDIAVLFIDIRGFTTMSEGLHPEEVVSILNEYFGLVTDAIFKNKGTLDKFIGDAAMAVFNSPNDLDDYVYRAVHTAWDIALGSQELAQKLLEKHGRTINYGIGVNCGPATIGNIGSEFRMDFTAIGDTVNTSARLEANAKAGQILISQAVYDIVKDWIETEEIGTIPLKGKSNEIFVYNVVKVIDKPGYIESRSESGKKTKRNRVSHGQI